MSIRIRYFASLRERLGRAADELEHYSGLTANEVWQQLWPEHPMPPNTLIAVNHQYCEPDVVLEDGDELAFFPPVTGG